MWKLEQKTPPTVKPFDSGYAKEHSRIQNVPASEDLHIEGAIDAAIAACESYTGRQLLPATWTLLMDSWWEKGIYRDGALFLPLPPLRSVASIKYRDTSGALQTWPSSAYTVETPVDVTIISHTQARARAWPNVGVPWPSIRCQPRAVEIEFIAGWADASKVPAGLISGMVLIVAELYERREEATTGAIVTPNVIRARSLWSPYRDGNAVV